MLANSVDRDHLGRIAQLLAIPVALLVLGSLLGHARQWLRRRTVTQAAGCAAPPRLPQVEHVLGLQNIRQMLQAVKQKRMLEMGLERYTRVANTFSTAALGKVFVHTIEPENLKAVLATNFRDFGVGPRIEIFGQLLGAGIFTTDDQAWEHSRALVRPNFTKMQIVDLAAFEDHLQNLFRRIPADGAPLDLQALFFQLTLDSATHLLFGRSVHSLLAAPDSAEMRFMSAFDLAQARAQLRPRSRLVRKYWRDAEFDEACRVVHAFVDRLVAELLAEDKTEDPAGGTPSRYVFLRELARETRDPRRLRDECLNVLLAGRDTTASLLSNTFFVMARRPDIWEKCRREVAALEGRLPSYETLRGLKYVRYLLNESLRLYPVVPLNSRYAKRDTMIPVGGGPDGKSPVFIREGQGVSYSLYAMHRRRDIYGDDAHVFNPDRWDDPHLRPGWGYLPFNGGPRICVGQQFALTEASYVVVRMLQRFSAIESRDDQPWTENLGLTTCSLHGTQVALFREL